MTVVSANAIEDWGALTLDDDMCALSFLAKFAPTFTWQHKRSRDSSQRSIKPPQVKVLLCGSGWSCSKCHFCFKGPSSQISLGNEQIRTQCASIRERCKSTTKRNEPTDTLHSHQSFPTLASPPVACLCKWRPAWHGTQVPSCLQSALLPPRSHACWSSTVVWKTRNAAWEPTGGPAATFRRKENDSSAGGLLYNI